MANKKTQKKLTISKTKSEKIVEWFVHEAHWKVLSENMDLGKTAIFKYKKILQNSEEGVSSFDLLANNFTLKQLNTIISVFNDYIDNPEKYEKPRKKSDVNLEEQEEKVRKHMKDMHMDYPKKVDEVKNLEKPNANVISEEDSEIDSKDIVEAENIDNLKEESKTILETPDQVLERHAIEVKKEREEIDKLPVGSPQREEKERQFKRNAIARQAEFMNVQKKHLNTDK